jgi:hypothetical protein
MRIADWVIVLCVMGPLACRSERTHSPTPPPDLSALPIANTAAARAVVGTVSIPREEWEDFVRKLITSLRRNVPEERNGKIVSIRYFPGPRAPGARIGLMRGDHLVDINGNGDWEASKNPNDVLITEMERSLASCAISFTVVNAGEHHRVAARCL